MFGSPEKAHRDLGLPGDDLAQIPGIYGNPDSDADADSVVVDEDSGVVCAVRHHQPAS